MYIVVNSAYHKTDKWVMDDNVYFGPFSTEKAANDWARKEYSHFGWWIAKLWSEDE